ncbi:TniB family NTP-binding protein [Pseudomonas coronafaciens]|uniref:TniB family NTP-binding protein n=1 Tax=Pseudomonas coronafaciens TaxID=53409 RepID=UPI000EFFCF91|nr:TniB family NTP-binding protein [Pseudomonas coronafaciens]
MTEYAHISLQFRDIMLKSDLDRIGFMDYPRWIEYRAGSALLDILDGLLRKPERPRMPNLMVIGDSNCGKTTVIRRFKDSSGKPYVSDDATSIRPVIYIEVHKPEERELYTAILSQFWAPHNPAAPLAKLRHQALHLLRQSRTRMLIIDEAHTINNGSPTRRLDTMNELKMLGNVLSIALVLVGTRNAAQLLVLDSQYASRYELVSLPAWSPNAEFQRFLKSFESILPLKQPSKLYSPELATFIHGISGGNTGNVEYLLRECAKEAIQKGCEVIDRKLLEKNQCMRPTRTDGTRERTL